MGFPGFQSLYESYRSSTVYCVFVCVYLVGAPVPGGQYGEPQGHARPRQVTSDGVSKQMHGVFTWQVAGAVGNDLTGHRHTVHPLQVVVATNLVKCCRRGTQSSEHNNITTEMRGQLLQ